jgi:polar amino acid transport system permease protein/polar amino acid transport system substrate-binding protein
LKHADVGRPLLGWLLAAIFVGFTGSQALADDAPRDALRQRLDSGILRWGGDAEGGAPFVLRDPHNPSHVIGFEVELIDALAEILSGRAGVPLRAEFVQYEWDSLPPGLDKHDFDVILNGYEITPERRRRVLFSRPYYAYAEQLVVRLDETRIESVADCRHRPIGTMVGTAAERLLEDAGMEHIVGFSGQVEPYLDLELGRLDAVLLDTPIVVFYGATNPKLKLVGKPEGDGFYGIGLRPDDQLLAAELDRGLGQLIESGRLREILDKWHLWNAAQSRLAETAHLLDELHGLGFDPQGKPLARDKLPPVEQVDRNIIAASANLWTFDKYAPLLLSAAGMTVMLTAASMVLAIAVGLVVALCRLYGPRPLSSLALAYVEFFRGIPLLLVLFFLYFGLAHYGVKMDGVLTAIVGFGMTYGAYEAEVYRSAILSIAPGQWEAARALGMPEPLAFRRIIFPQALRTALGPMTNDFVALFKDTSLVSVIAVRELTKEYLILSRSSLKFVELGLLTAALYLAMSIPLGYLSRYLEKRWGAGR